jgi:hypothetical protein
MEIASFDSRSEAQQVLDAVLKTSSSAWVGMERFGYHREFINRKLATVSLPWAKGEPNNAGNRENCVTVDKGGYNDIDCINIDNFVCQMLK